jgi:hypothetical protein
MYKATQDGGAQGEPTAENNDGNSNTSSEDVTDAEYEEVTDKK